MIVLNETGNTIYVQDLDMHIPHDPDNEITLNPETLKSSKSLRSFIINGMLTIQSFNKDEKIENSIMYMRSKTSVHLNPPREEVPILDPEPVINCTNDIEVKLHGMFYDAGGYSKVNRNLAINLSNAGIKVKVSAKRSQNQLREEEIKPLKLLEQTQISKNHILIDSIVPSFSDISSGKYKILYTTIESYTIPKQFVECCQLYDEIWLTSEWSAEILRKYVDKPIYCIQTGVDHNLYSEHGPKFDFKPSINNFVFVSVFGWSYRKGYDALLKAYFDEFDRRDDVSLLIVSRYQSGTSKFHRNRIKSDIDKIIEHFPNKDLPHVVRYSQLIPEVDMPKLYRAANAFVLSTRGEGGCTIPGTKIITQEGLKPIEVIGEGTMVLTHKGNWKPVTSTKVRYTKEPMYDISSSLNKDVISLTGEHPCFVLPRNITIQHGQKDKSKFTPENCEWIIPSKIEVGDYVVMPLNLEQPNTHYSELIKERSVRTDKYLYLPVKEVQQREYQGYVYNLEVEEDNSYTTNCFTVHNCLPPLEASLCGLPVIMTNCSGQQGYLRKDNSYPIEVDQIVEMQPGQMHIHYWDGQKFPALTSSKFHNSLKETLRQVYNNYDDAKLKNKKLQQMIMNKFTWNTNTNLALERLRQISDHIRKS